MKDFFDYAGYVTTVVVFLQVIGGLLLWGWGIVPVLMRLGNGLARRKIAIFAEGNSLVGLESLLHDSKLFRRTNLIKIAQPADIGAGEDASVFIVYWPAWKDQLSVILQKKKSNTALIVYAPQEYGYIPKEQIEVLGKHRNVVVTNFRGRLLNDIVTSMITTSYEKN
jgi:hypothetical protein